MSKRHLILMATFVTFVACKRRQPPQQQQAEPAAATSGQPTSDSLDRSMLAAYQPLPEDAIPAEDNPLSEAKINLGRMLYYDPRLSKNHDVSCNSCHMLDQYGVDNKAVSEGHRGQKGTRNSPTVYNAAGHFVQFWDGRALDVEEQAKAPVLNPVEMALPDEAYAVRVIASIPGYVEAFKQAFAGDENPVSYDNIAKAIGAFERKLLTPSRWDALLEGDDDALTPAEKAGFKQFVSAGCPTCHTGAYLGGHMYQKVGLVKPWPNQADLGRYELTKDEADKMMFKVPSLRNVVQTAPYFHDGSVAELADAVKMIADHQLGRTLSEAEAASIVTFLGSLTGKLPRDFIKKPELPPSGEKTPEPDPT